MIKHLKEAGEHLLPIAPKVTLADIEANIVSEQYFTAEEGAQGRLAKVNPDLGMENSTLALITFCVLTLRNGFTVTGESACVSPENFDAEDGRKIARQKAVEKIWPLMGYELRNKLKSGDQLSQNGEKYE